MKKYLLPIVALFFIFIAQPVKAESTIGVSPVIINVELSPGKIYEYQITVTNNSNTPLPATLTFENFNSDEDGIDLNHIDQNVNSILDWATVSPKDIIIPAKSKKTVTLTLTLPEKIPLGGYYGVLFVEPVIPAKADTSLVTAKVGVLMLANIGVSTDKNKVEVISSEFNKSIYSSGPVKNTLRIRNTTLNHFTAKPILRIEPLFGEPVTVPLEEKIIFPGKIRRWDSSFELPDYYHGFYKTVLTISTGKGHQEVREGYILAFPLLKAFGIILLLVLLTLSVIYRRRILKGLRILISGK